MKRKFNDIEGLSFSQAWENREEVGYDGVRINFIGLEELLILEKLAGRSQDRVDVEKLEARNKK